MKLIKVLGYTGLTVALAISVAMLWFELETRHHISRFDARIKPQQLLPYEVRLPNGDLYTGPVYGTYFGDRFGDIKEWEGHYQQGKPSGEFRYLSPEGEVLHRWQYRLGVEQTDKP